MRKYCNYITILRVNRYNKGPINVAYYTKL